ncbi:hypothetical protein L2E82_35858 [Cichorium intybus]|uniref:Uncharacterized protein n=1 Tax=Cichorium intybus TaxID=13427 RepID=A0ACB9BPY2_CICIN|nr:hypothetical protein L2E82_35858 [Cichorium intybus]
MIGMLVASSRIKFPSYSPWKKKKNALVMERPTPTVSCWDCKKAPNSNTKQQQSSNLNGLMRSNHLNQLDDAWKCNFFPEESFAVELIRIWMDKKITTKAETNIS